MAFELILGPARSGKTEAVLETLADLLRVDPFTPHIVILPSNRAIEAFTDRLLAAGPFRGLIQPRFYTLLDISRALSEPTARGNGIKHELSVLGRTLFLQRAVGELRKSFSRLLSLTEKPGFISLLGDLITELKEHLIDPEELPTQDPLWADVRQVFRQYEKDKDRAGLWDTEDLFVEASRLSREGWPGGLREAGFFFIDGFYDFNPLQLSLVQHLLQEVPQGVVTLPFEEGRPEVFEMADHTLERLRGAAAQVRCLEVDAAAKNYPLRMFERSLLAPSFSAQGAGASLPVEVYPAADAWQEVEGIARRVKRLILEGGLLPRQIAVLFRRLEDYRSPVEQVFRDFGIPLRPPDEVHLMRHPRAKALLRFLRLVREGFPAHDTLLFLSNPHLSLLRRRGLSPRTLSRLFEEARCKGERKHIEARLRSLAEKKKPLDPEGQKVSLKEVSQALGAVGELFGAAREIPHRGTPSDMCQGLLTACERIGILEDPPFQAKILERTPLGSTSHQWAARDQRVSEALRRALENLFRAHEEIKNLDGDRKAAPLSLGAFASLLRLALEEATYPDRLGTGDGVSLLDVNTARGLHFDAVFIGGLTANEFPSPGWVNPLAGDGARVTLSRHVPEKPLVRKGQKLPEEDLLFYLAATRASRFLFLSYPRRDFRRRERPLSRFVEAARRLSPEAEVSEMPWSRGPASRAELRERVLTEISAMASAPEGRKEPFSPAALKTSMALWGYRFLEKTESALLRQVERAISMEALRLDAQTPSLPNGLIAWPLVAELFGQTKTLRLSITQLNTFGECPFKFMARYALGLEPAEPFDEEVLPAERGRLLHRILTETFRGLGQLHQERGGTWPGVDEKEALTLLSRVAGAHFSRREKQWPPLYPGIWKTEKARILRGLERLLSETLRGNFRGGSPSHFEVAFGLEGGEDALSTTAPLFFSGPPPLEVEGKIDRIDLGDDQSFSVMDYKTGKGAPGPRDIRDGVDFQISLYLLAAQRLFFPNLKISEGYYLRFEPLKRSGHVTEGGGGRSIAWETLLPQVEEHLKTYASAIQAGEFPVSPRSCSSTCQYRPICRKVDPTPSGGSGGSSA